MWKVLVTRFISESALMLLRNQGFDITVYSKKENVSQTDLIALCQQHDALLSVGPNEIDECFLAACKHLRAIALMSVGYDNVDVVAATKYGIPISNTPEVLSDATADIAFLLMLSVARNAFYMHKKIAQGDWGFYDPMKNLGQELSGKTLGIFGLGRIGFEFAKKAKAAYGMDIFIP